MKIVLQNSIFNDRRHLRGNTFVVKRTGTQSAKEAGIAVVDGGTYAAVQGPRLETKAEIDRLERDGATMVGMTGMPEAALARELGLQYVHLCVVVNPAAGRGTSARTVSFEDIGRVIEETMGKARKIVATMVAKHGRS